MIPGVDLVLFHCGWQGDRARVVVFQSCYALLRVGEISSGQARLRAPP